MKKKQGVSNTNKSSFQIARLSTICVNTEALNNVYIFKVDAGVKAIHAIHSPTPPASLTLFFMGKPGPVSDYKLRYYTVQPQLECHTVLIINDLLSYEFTITGERGAVWHLFQVGYEAPAKGKKYDQKPDEKTTAKTGAKIIEFKVPDSTQ